MQKKIESVRPSSLQEVLNIIAGLLILASLGIKTGSSIKNVASNSGLSPEDGEFTKRIVDQADKLAEQAKNK